MILRLFVVLGLMLGTLHLGSAHEEKTYEVDIQRDIPYYTGADADPVRHLLDLYRPLGRENYPVLMFIHGGAWVSGSKEDVANFGPAFASRGIGVVTVNYRLSPTVTHPAHIEDIARAFAWVAENIADYGGDPSRIIVGGHSAGGHLASLLTFDSQYLEAVKHSPDEIAGVLSVSGVYWIDDWIVQWAHGAFPKDKKGRDAVSPIKLVHEDAPPFLVLVSQDDYPNLIDEADAMVAALEKAEIDTTFAHIPERDHYSVIQYIGTKRDKATEVMLEWLNSTFEKAEDEEKP